MSDTPVAGQGDYSTVATHANQISTSVNSVVPPATFVFWAGFDGTKNIGSNPGYSGDAQSTAIFALQGQIVQSDTTVAKYYAGVGTPDTLPGSKILPREQAERDAQKAYDDYAKAADTFLLENPNGSVTAMLATFSRGTIAGAIFAEKLYAEGLVLDGKTLVPPGEASVSAVLSISPVSTLGGDVRYPPNIKNFTEVLADNDYRLGYQQDLYPGANQVHVTGNHCDIGGCYVGGIGSILLQKFTEFFDVARPGMIGPVLPSRQYEGGASLDVHRESVDPLNPDTYLNGVVTGSYGDGTKVGFVPQGQSASGYCTSDGTVASYITMKGEKVVITSMGGITQSVTVNGVAIPIPVTNASPTIQTTLNADGSTTVSTYDPSSTLLQTTTTLQSGAIEQVNYDAEQVATSVLRTLPRATDGASITNFYDGTGIILKASVIERIVDGDPRITSTTTVNFDVAGAVTASTEVIQNKVTNITETTDLSIVGDTVTGRKVTTENFDTGIDTAKVYGENDILLSSSETSRSGGLSEKQYIDGVAATEIKVVQDLVTDAPEAVTAIYTDGEISSLAVTPSIGATHPLDLTPLTATERKS